MKAYIHKVRYYETDKMGFVHHSNYIRWMEEARVDFMDQLGYGYEKLEAGGIMSPVVSIECEYKEPTSFPDEIEISVSIEKLTGVKLELSYEMKKADCDRVCCKAGSKHCFVDESGRIVNLKQGDPELFSLLNDAMG